jgi:Nebulin repeat
VWVIYSFCVSLEPFFSFPLKVADDPETLRIKQNTKNISNVAYHGELQKKAAMEKQRECTEIIDSRGE